MGCSASVPPAIDPATGEPEKELTEEEKKVQQFQDERAAKKAKLVSILVHIVEFV